MDNQGTDIIQARTFLARRFDVDPSTVELIGEGAWSRCFGFQRDGKELVIRFGKYVEDFRKDQHAFTHAAPGLPIPEVLDLGRAFDGYYAISTRAHGVPLETLDAKGWLAIVPEIATALEALRLTNLSSTRGFGGWGSNGLAPYDSWSEYLLSAAEDSPDKRGYGWRERLAGHGVGETMFAWGFNALKSLDSVNPPRSLVHADLINRNILVKGDILSAVFDWGCSIYGDHLYDLAWFEFWSPWYPEMDVECLKAELQRRWRDIGYTPVNKESRLMACHLHIGLDHLAYNAFTGNWSALSLTAERMKSLIMSR